MRFVRSRGAVRRCGTGKGLVLKYAGRDATEEFLDAHPETIIRRTLPDQESKIMGKIDRSTLPAEASQPRTEAKKKKMPAAMMGGCPIPPVGHCINAFDFEAVAKRRMALESREKGSARAARRLPHGARMLRQGEVCVYARVRCVCCALELFRWAYYSSGAEDELSLRENHSVFHRIRLKPRVLVNVKTVRISCRQNFTLWPCRCTSLRYGL